MADERKRAGRFETVGAWLHIWTPARDAEVPPVPWRRLLLIGLPLLALVSATAWLAVRDASEAKRERETIAAREEAQSQAAERERLRTEQAVRVERTDPAPRPVLVHALEAAILDDARRRFGRADFDYRAERVECEPHPRTATRREEEVDPSIASGRYYCVAVTSDIVGIGEGSIGYPFFARIRYGQARLAWCKINPVPGEQAVPDPRGIVRLPAGCT